jgi:TRAP-type mannitol/chloroaromatic compound transport system permease small subunit
MFWPLFGIFLARSPRDSASTSPLPWTDELAVVLYLWVILWAAAFMVPTREHVVFDLVWNSVARARAADDDGSLPR